jgi:hypothetical protein
MAIDRNIGGAGTGTGRGTLDKVATVETISALKTFTGSEDAVIVQGYYAAGDGGGGDFYWDSTSTETANDGTTVQATGVTTGRWIRIYSGAVNVRWFGAKGDGVTDDGTALQSAINELSARGEAFLPNGVYLHTVKINLHDHYTTLRFEHGAILKANAAMDCQIEIGDGVNRKEGIYILNPWLKGNSLADYGIRDSGTRISNILDPYYEGHLEYCNVQEVIPVDYSEFLNIERGQGFDSKGFYKHIPTANSRATDTTLTNNVMFRPTEYFAVLDTCQRFNLNENMVGSQTNAFAGGVKITAGDVHTLSITAEHKINGLYIESNATYGAGIIGVDIQNDSTLTTVGGCNMENVLVQPANLVTLCKLSTPTTANTIRQISIDGIDAKAGFASTIVIEADVAWTRINSENFDGNTSGFLSDSGTNTVINGLAKQAAGKASAVTIGDIGDLILNTSNDSVWTKDHSGAFKQVGFGSIVYSETRGLPSIGAGANLIISITVAGVTLGDYAQVSMELGLQGLIMAAYARTGLVDISIYNPTAGAIDIASTTLRLLVTKH